MVLPRLDLNHDLPTSKSQVARITGICYHAQPYQFAFSGDRVSHSDTMEPTSLKSSDFPSASLPSQGQYTNCFHHRLVLPALKLQMNVNM
jgi:hypothetical protein